MSEDPDKPPDWHPPGKPPGWIPPGQRPPEPGFDIVTNPFTGGTGSGTSYFNPQIISVSGTPSNIRGSA